MEKKLFKTAAVSGSVLASSLFSILNSVSQVMGQNARSQSDSRILSSIISQESRKGGGQIDLLHLGKQQSFLQVDTILLLSVAKYDQST